MACSFVKLNQILFLDECFRNPNPNNCTRRSIIEKFNDHFYSEGSTLGNSSFYEYLNKFNGLGAIFKGRETAEKFYFPTIDGRQKYYQYEDLNCTLPGLEKMLGDRRKDTGMELLKMLEEEKKNGSVDSANIWLRIFLKRMLGKEDANFNVVSFYDNIDLMMSNSDAFEKILDAIFTEQPIIFKYKYGLHPIVKLHPYRLKNYNQRWYVIGRRYNDNVCEEFPDRYYSPYAIIPINGIETKEEDGCPKADIRPWKTPFISPDNDELDDYFTDLIGVTLTSQGPQNVYLRFSPLRYDKYVKTKPLSPTQILVKPGSPYYDPQRPTIKLKVHVNKELKQQILSFGGDCEVIEPQSLKDDIHNEILRMLEPYAKADNRD